MSDDTSPAISDSEESHLARALDYRYLSLQIAAEEAGGPFGEPSDFFHESSGTVRLSCLEEEIHFTIGEFSVVQVDLEGAWRAGFSAYDVLDTTAPAFEFFQVLYKDQDYSRVAVKALGGRPIASESILILDRLLILPSFRGHGLGLKALKIMMHRFGFGAGIVALKAFPLQFEHDTAEDLNLGLKCFKRTPLVAQRKLIKLYEQAGFVAIGRTPYMLRSSELPVLATEIDR